MVENTYSSPVFANRYRYETVPDDWDTGKSGLTFLVYDLEKKRRGVIKRAETKSHDAVNGLKNEIAALLALKGENVPEVYESGEAKSGTKNYFYLVVEHIEGVRIEKNLDFLSASERVEVLTQFFNLLANSHRMGIVNGDIDLKHLFWRRDQKRLAVIDWGNAKLNIDPNNKKEFAYDLARSAEIIYSLTTHKGRLPASGTVALPNDSALTPGLAPVQEEFRTICKWAPRMPSDGSLSPHTAQELFEASIKWRIAIDNKKTNEYHPSTHKLPRLVWIPIFAIVALLVFLSYGFYSNSASTPTADTNTTIITSSVTPTLVPSKAPSSTKELVPTTEPTPNITITQTPGIPAAPNSYSPILIFDKKQNSKQCWNTETDSALTSITKGGFLRREDGGWSFKVNRGEPKENFIKTTFGRCSSLQNAKAISINAWIMLLEPEREFGIFIEDKDTNSREYTIWLDNQKNMHLRVRENDSIVKDDVILIVKLENLKYTQAYPRSFYEFPIQIFFEIDHQGYDILYLREGRIKEENIDPAKALFRDVRFTLKDVTDLGLIGYGGENHTLIWPMILFGDQ